MFNEVKNGTIVSVYYNEIHISDWGKHEGEEYCDEMSTCGTTPAIAYPVMEKQDLMEVDA